MPERLREMLEKALESTLFASRWLLAPFYLGIVLGVVILLIKFMQELWHLALGRRSRGVRLLESSEKTGSCVRWVWSGSIGARPNLGGGSRG